MRAKGEGTIYYDKAADRWRGLIDLGKDGRGKRIRRKVTGRTRTEAAERLAALRKEIEDGARAPSTMTVADLIDEWLAKVTPTMTPRNAEFARWTAGHSRDRLGQHRLLDLRVAHVEDALAELPEAGLNITSIRRVRSTLRRILKWGQGHDYVGGKNVADHAELPAARAADEGRSLTAEELNRLLDAFAGTRLEALWQTMAWLGLRPAEALGLTWDNVDFDQETVSVVHALKWCQGKPYLGAVKTRRSKRTLKMSPRLAAALRRHRTEMVTERLALGWPEEWAELVFVSETGTPLDSSNIRRAFDRGVRTAKIGHLRPYDLRHTCASLMADKGVRLEDIADQLGHDGTDMARDTYVHRLTDVIDAAVGPLGEVLSG